MTTATWKGVVLAESDSCEQVEGNYYFPPDSINEEYFKETGNRTSCHWKGVAHYYTIKVNGEENVNAAWLYPETKEKAKRIKGYVAFRKGVKVE